MNKNFVRAIILATAFIGAACSPRMPDNLIPIGVEARNLESDPLSFKNIKYRTIDFVSSKKVVESNIDLVDLVLEAQTNPIRDSAVLIGVLRCFAPAVRDGFPSVQCHAGNSTTIYLVGDNNIRSQLLRLEDSKNHGYVVGRILRFYSSGTLMFYVK